MGEHGGVLGQGVHAAPDAGADAAPHIDPFGIHRIHSGGGAEIQHQQRCAVFLYSGHAGHAAVGAVVVGGGAPQIAQGGKDVLVDHQGTAAQVFHHGAFEGVHDAGHH